MRRDFPVSRADLRGLWWDDPEPTSLRAGPRTERLRIVAPPVTGWTPPKDFPNLSGARVLGLDTETKDLELTSRGPGAVRGAGHVVGVSVATEDAAWYFPVRHEYTPEAGMNMDPQKVFAWLRDQLKESRPIVGANLLYDLEFLRAEGVPAPQGELFDVQYAEPLIDETARSYALDVLSKKYLGEGKHTEELYTWSAASFGGDANGRQRANIWRSPPSLVGPYAERDALAPLQVLSHQRKIMAEEGLTDLFRLECGLIPLLLEMRFQGVRIDLDKAERSAKWLREEAAKAQTRIPGIDVWSNDSIARAFDKAGIAYERTAAGNPSFTRQWLEGCATPLAQAVLDVRLYEKAANPFIESYILENHVNGIIHCQFHPLRSDEYGAVSGRMSSSNPNLQNIPVRHPVIGPLMRSLFIARAGSRWRRADYNQIEYRLMAHYAVDPPNSDRKSADDLRARYNSDASTDYHQMTIELVKEFTGIELTRPAAKNLNFGMLYGLGKENLLLSLGATAERAKVEALYDAYLDGLPCVKATYNSAQRLAEARGYIKTILGRRSRFLEFEENPYRAGQMQRAGARKALNRVFQGGAADILKKAMLDCWKEGLFYGDNCPHLTVHDELDWSDPGDPAHYAKVEQIMTHGIALKVPLLVKMEIGDHWGNAR